MDASGPVRADCSPPGRGPIVLQHPTGDPRRLAPGASVVLDSRCEIATVVLEPALVRGTREDVARRTPATAGGRAPPE
jgi:hypothetical protein